MLAWSFAIKDANNSELMYTKSLKSMLYGITLRVVLAFVLSLAASIFSYAQDRTVRVYYPYDDATLMRDYMDNANAFAEIAEIIASNSEVVPCFEIISYSSPEGDWNYNLQLSRRRAKSLKRYLERKYPELAGTIPVLKSFGLSTATKHRTPRKGNSGTWKATRNSTDISSAASVMPRSLSWEKHQRWQPAEPTEWNVPTR